MADPLPTTSHIGLGLLRVVSGLLFLQHGTQKLFSFPDGPANGLAWTFSLPGLAGFIELACGILLIFGLFTRLAAFVASGTMAVAYWMIHAPQGLYPIGNGGELAILYCFVFLLLFFAGPGAWNLDGLLKRQRAEAKARAAASGAKM